MQENSWNTIRTALIEALHLILSGDPMLFQILRLTLEVALGALFLASLVGVPGGAFCGLHGSSRVRYVVRGLFYTAMGLPSVVVGLAVYLLVSRSGPLGDWAWLFTPRAMVAAQTLLAVPLVLGLTMAAVEAVDPALGPQLVSLGATGAQKARYILLEARGGVLAAVAAAFGAAISEVGAVMLVGGNIDGHTRVLTTAIVLETRRGEFSMALALGLILIGLTVLVNFALLLLGRAGGIRAER
jgi:tungstate transport system permease protein